MRSIELVVVGLLALAVLMSMPSRRRRVVGISSDSGFDQSWRWQLSATLVRSARRRWRPTARRAAMRSAGVELVSGLASELRAGRPVRVALERATVALPLPICPQAVGMARLGGDVPAALRRDAEDLDLPILRSLAALWQVAEGSGAGLAEAADRLAASYADAEGVRRELVAQLAGPKATARVLACLPIVGLILGSGLGASPIEWLFGSAWGLLILALGVGLEILGIWWTNRLTRGVEQLL